MDTHWVGGNPGKNEVYGWASWTPHKAILVLRNPDDQPAAFNANLQQIFELPKGAAKTYHFQSPWKNDRSQLDLRLVSDEPHTFRLKPFETLVLETE